MGLTRVTERYGWGLNSESEEETEELRPAALVILLADIFF